MSLRQFFGLSNGELMRPDAKPCSAMMRQTASIFCIGGALAFWTLSRVHYGPRITFPRAVRWGLCGAVTCSSSTALLVRLFSTECEPQNIAAYDKPTSPWCCQLLNFVQNIWCLEINWLGWVSLLTTSAISISIILMLVPCYNLHHWHSFNFLHCSCPRRRDLFGERNVKATKPLICW